MQPAAQRALVAFAELARRAKLRWYVCCAEAVNLYGFPRATADLDLTIDLQDRDPAGFVARLRRDGFDARFDDADFIRATRVIPVVHRATGLPVDLVLAGPGLEQVFLDGAHRKRLAGVTVPVISPEHLIVTKLLAGRPKDLEDVRELLAIRGATLDASEIEELLRELEAPLGQRDLVPLFHRLRDDVRAR